MQYYDCKNALPKSEIIFGWRNAHPAGFCRDCFHEAWDMARGAAELMRFGLIAFDTSAPSGPVFRRA